MREPDKKLLKFLQIYPENIQIKALELREMVLAKEPNSFELIYDSYNALSIAFSLSDILNEAFCHIALYSNHVNLGFNYGSELDDPENLLNGSGKHIRHLKIMREEDPGTAAVQEFIQKSVEHIHQKFPDLEPQSNPEAIVKSVSGKKKRSR